MFSRRSHLLAMSAYRRVPLQSFNFCASYAMPDLSDTRLDAPPIAHRPLCETVAYPSRPRPRYTISVNTSKLKALDSALRS